MKKSYKGIKITENKLRIQVQSINLLLGVKNGDIWYCFLSSLPGGRSHLVYEVEQIINEKGTTRDFLGIGESRGNVLSKAITTFIEGFKLAPSKNSTEN